MPELPEVETVVNGLRPLILEKSITEVAVFRAKPIRGLSSESFSRRVTRHTIAAISRRGKYLIFKLKPELFLLAHLRMTGKFIVASSERQPQPHDRVWFGLSNGALLVYADARCLGTLELTSQAELDIRLSRLGAEPLSKQLTAPYISRICGSSRPIKGLLLDQTKIAGIGNIYASEILFRAQIHPQRAANTLTRTEHQRLATAIRAILRKAIEFQGTSVSDFRRVDDSDGGFQALLAVYQKTDQPCPRCGALIQRLIQQQRSGFFCPRCQV